MSWLLNNWKQGLVFALVMLYLIADLIQIRGEVYIFNLLPVILLLVYLAVARFDLIYFIIVFFTPLSIQLINFFQGSPIDFAIPTEPMLFGMMLLFLFKIIHDKSMDLRFLRHPVTYAIMFNLGWILVTAATSSMPTVSFKFLLARIWFITIYYLLAIYILRRIRNIAVFIGCYTASMVVVVIYTVTRHIHLGIFDKQVAHFVMAPFFRDHTSYGAVLAMLLFAIPGVLLHRSGSRTIAVFGWIFWIIIAIGLILSYTRAAWLSVLASLGVLALTLLRVRFRYIFVFGVIALVYLSADRTTIIQKMRQNRQASSASLTENVKSVSNITTDESNLERINRWNSALRMFRERPVFGWGPGTYMFQYAPFQLSSEKTLISTDFGNLGNAHSEYIGPLAESGLLGSLSFILVIVMSLVTGFKVYKRVHERYVKQIVLSFLLALITYLVHGTMNNFLDTDKASALFWGFIATFVTLDIYFIPDKQTGQAGQ